MPAKTSTDPLNLQKFTIDTATDWMGYSGTLLADGADEDDTPAMKLGAIGFTRAPAGADSEFEFAYDEALIVTKGACTIRSCDDAVSVGVGEVVFLPAGIPGKFHADEALELFDVASSPYGEVNREAKAQLLEQRRRSSDDTKRVR